MSLGEVVKHQSQIKQAKQSKPCWLHRDGGIHTDVLKPLLAESASLAKQNIALSRILQRCSFLSTSAQEQVDSSIAPTQVHPSPFSNQLDKETLLYSFLVKASLPALHYLNT